MNTLVPSKSVTAIDKKGRKFMTIVSTAYDNAELSDEEAQRINDTPGLADLINGFIAENRLTDKYKDEEVASNYAYLSGYKPRGIVEQTNRLRELFAGIGYPNQNLLGQIEKGEAKLPRNTECPFAIPNLWKPEGLPKIFGSTYSAAVQIILDKLSETHEGKFVNYCKGAIDEQHLCQSARTKKFFQELSEAQGNPDILLVPAQFGIRHRGRSVRRAREVFASNEFGLGAFAVGIMLLTHPERLQHYDDLWIDCAGDEFSPAAGGAFSESPCFYFRGGRLQFVAHDVDDARGHYGSASGSSPQKKVILAP